MERRGREAAPRGGARALPARQAARENRRQRRPGRRRGRAARDSRSPSPPPGISPLPSAPALGLMFLARSPPQHQHPHPPYHQPPPPPGSLGAPRPASVVKGVFVVGACARFSLADALLLGAQIHHKNGIFLKFFRFFLSQNLRKIEPLTTLAGSWYPVRWRAGVGARDPNALRT
jgi:hypothetical protein